MSDLEGGSLIKVVLTVGSKSLEILYKKESSRLDRPRWLGLEADFRMPQKLMEYVFVEILAF